ncbi:MAG: hypothetical protein MUF72_01825 [Elainella sp. Prado103]|jgi:hypothetical protein|nr:hypothetical protein [Elainella sp. Prado103]
MSLPVVSVLPVPLVLLLQLWLSPLPFLLSLEGVGGFLLTSSTPRWLTRSIENHANRSMDTDPDPPTDPPIDSPQWIRPPVACPTELERLVPRLLMDLPSYANRVSQRSYTDYRTAEVPGYILLAGRPEYEPLPLPTGDDAAAIERDEIDRTVNNPEVLQVFFTTLERQYLADNAYQLQHYHWLFLTHTDNGWRFVLMLSSVGNARADEPPTPPRDSSQGVIAQAIRLWLRDCEAQSVAQ